MTTALALTLRGEAREADGGEDALEVHVRDSPSPEAAQRVPQHGAGLGQRLLQAAPGRGVLPAHQLDDGGGERQPHQDVQRAQQRVGRPTCERQRIESGRVKKVQ